MSIFKIPLKEIEKQKKEDDNTNIIEIKKRRIIKKVILNLHQSNRTYPR